MQPIQIVPEYTLVLTYDIRAGLQELCYRYMAGEFIPTLQNHHVYMFNAWQIPYGHQPEWQVEFVTEQRGYLKDLFLSDDWERMESRLKALTHNYVRRVFPYRGVFHI